MIEWNPKIQSAFQSLLDPLKGKVNENIDENKENITEEDFKKLTNF